MNTAIKFGLVGLLAALLLCFQNCAGGFGPVTGQNSVCGMNGTTCSSVTLTQQSITLAGYAGQTGETLCRINANSLVECRTTTNSYALLSSDADPVASFAASSSLTGCLILKTGVLRCLTSVGGQGRDVPGPFTAATDSSIFRCAVLTNGQVQCWGANTYGQIGNGTTATANTPTLVTGLTNVASLASSDWGVCAVLKDHTVSCWGRHFTTSYSGSQTPQQIPSLTNVQQISLSNYFGCALLLDGTVKCWGNQTNFTSNSTVAYVDPVTVNLPLASAIHTGDLALCAVGLTDSKISCLGSGPSRGLATVPVSPATIVAGIPASAEVTVGPTKSCAKTLAGEIYCWGNVGQYNSETTSNNYNIAVPTTLIAASTKQFVELTGKGNSICGRDNSGTISCWGSAARLLPGASVTPPWDYLYSYAPPSPAQHVFTQTYPTVCFDTAANDLRCYGRDPLTTTITSPVAQGVGGQIQFIMRQGNGVVQWMGQLYATHYTASSLTALPDLANAVSVTSGDNFLCGVLASGVVRCFGAGSNDRGSSLGNAAWDNVAGISTAVAVDAGGASGCALTSDTGVTCWGDIVAGISSNRLPVVIAGLTGVSSISVGIAHACAVMTNGHVQCWGTNTYHELGLPILSSTYHAPSEVLGLTGVAQVLAGSYFSVALLSTGEVKFWGLSKGTYILANGVEPYTAVKMIE